MSERKVHRNVIACVHRLKHGDISRFDLIHYIHYFHLCNTKAKFHKKNLQSSKSLRELCIFFQKLILTSLHVSISKERKNLLKSGLSATHSIVVHFDARETPPKKFLCYPGKTR